MPAAMAHLAVAGSMEQRSARGACGFSDAGVLQEKDGEVVAERAPCQVRADSGQETVEGIVHVAVREDRPQVQEEQELALSVPGFAEAVGVQQQTVARCPGVASLLGGGPNAQRKPGRRLEICRVTV